MLTRCPRCETLFQVTTEQLKAKRGKVRCGQCMAVFDGLESLVEPPAAPPPPPPPVPEPPAGEAPAAAEGIAVAEAPELAEEVPVAAVSAAPVALTAERETPPAEPPLEPLLSLLAEEEERPRRAWPWALGIFLFALPALLVQALLHFRVELAAMHPEAKPFLRSLSAPFELDLPLPRRIGQVSIESSDLHPAGGAAEEGRLQLTASLRNRASFAQAWPYLELSLTDVDDRLLLRKALAPNDWLPPGASPADGFPAGADQAVSLTLEAPGISAVGYRLYVFHP